MYDSTRNHGRFTRAAEPVDRRWEIAEIALQCRGRIVASVLRGYPKVSRDRIEELYDKVWERATQPIGEPAAFPESSYEKLEPWLRAALIGELRHEVSDRHSHTKRVNDPVVLDLQVDHRNDPAGTVEQKLELDSLMKSAGESLTERTKTYIGMTRIAGMSRAEFRERTGWNQKRIQRARKEWATFAARVRDGAAAFAPLAWLKRMFATGGDAAGAGSGILGGKAVLATCGAAAVCAGGAAGVVEVKHQVDKSNRPTSQQVKAAAQSIPEPTNVAPAPVGASSDAQTAPKKERSKRSASAAKRSVDKREPVEQEFGPQSVPQSAPSSASSEANSGGGSSGDGSSGGGSSGGGTSSSFSGEFSP